MADTAGAGKKLYIDFETRSSVDLNTTGAWKYAAHPSTDILCLAWALDNGPVTVYTTADLRAKKPLPFSDFLPPRLVAHNAHFEYAIWKHILAPRYGYPFFGPMYWSCTMARAAMCGLPLSLEHASNAVGAKFTKDMAGRAAMKKLCIPYATDPTTGDALFHNDDALFRTLYAYCARDVETERELDAILPDYPPGERFVWELDLLINERGIGVDVPLARKGVSLAAAITDELNAHLRTLTGGAVDKASRVAEIRRWIKDAHGIDLPDGKGSMDKAAVNALLARKDIPAEVKEVLNIRRQVGKSSTAKYEAVVNTAVEQDEEAGSRIRGVLQYHAAATGRWGGRLIQPQNFPGGYTNTAEQEAAIADIMGSDPGVYSLIHGDGAMDALSRALRGVIVAAPGHKLVVADYASIEARILFWEAGDENALNLYRRGADLYEDMASYIYKRPINAKLNKADKAARALGKAVILGAGYSMSARKFHATVAAQGLTLSEMEAESAIKAYRAKYERVVRFWRDIERAAVRAVQYPGKIHTCGGKDGQMFKWGYVAPFLVCRLPSGRHLRYFRPSVKIVDGPYGEKAELRYWGAGIGGRGIEEYTTYGGALTENVTQAVARDIMARGMGRVEEARFPVVLSVHDEVVAEVADTMIKKMGGEEAALDKFIRLLCPSAEEGWTAGLPIKAEGWVGRRYHK